MTQIGSLRDAHGCCDFIQRRFRLGLLGAQRIRGSIQLRLAEQQHRARENQDEDRDPECARAPVGPGGVGGAASASFGGNRNRPPGGFGQLGRRFRRPGNSGGRYAITMTSAARATPMATNEPSCARPGNPPKFNTKNALMVVMAAQRMLGAMARRISGTYNCGCASASC